MKTKNLFFFLCISISLIFLNCKKKDCYPIELKLKECTNPSNPILVTYNKEEPTDSSLPLAQTAMGYFDNNKDIWLLQSIILESEDASRFVAAAGGTLSVQSELEDISYTLVGDDFQFNLAGQQGKEVLATGDMEQITIPYRTFAKIGASSGGGHLPIDYESSLFTSFSPGDSLVYITYDVIYEVE